MILYKTTHYSFIIYTLRSDEDNFTMTEQEASRTLTESDSVERVNPLFKSGTPAYKRMVDMIQDLVKAKSQQGSMQNSHNEE